MKRRSLASSTLLVMSASAFSAVLGFGREIATAHFFGTRSEVDAFLNASTIPVVLFGIFNGSLVGALVPVFSDYTSTGRDEEVRKLGSTVINLLFFVLLALATLGWFLAPLLVPIVARGFPGPKQNLEIEMVRMLMPGIIATTLSGVCAALLNANHRFAASALVTVAANIVTIAFVITLHARLGIFALVTGSVLGLFAQLLVQMPSILKSKLYRFEMDLKHPGLRKAWALFIPVTLGSGAWQVNLAFDRYFASTLPAGSTAGLGYTTKIAFLPILIVAGAIGTVVFPLIAGQFANNDRNGIKHSISLAIGMVTFIVLPCAAGLTALAYPIVQTLFEYGAFGHEATLFCASLIPFACIPLVAISYNTVMARACYACKEMRLAVTSSFLVVFLNILLSAFLVRAIGARGLLLANGLSMFFGTTFLVFLLWRLSGGLDWRALVSSLFRIATASLAMAAVAAALQSLHIIHVHSMASKVCNLALLLAVSALVYIAASRLLGVTELDAAYRLVLRKFKSKSVDSDSELVA